jgi:hypothetical protein
VFHVHQCAQSEPFDLSRESRDFFRFVARPEEIEKGKQERHKRSEWEFAFLGLGKQGKSGEGIGKHEKKI